MEVSIIIKFEELFLLQAGQPREGKDEIGFEDLEKLLIDI